MRNLKKILALALALVMSMSLMATANAFTDDDSINDTYETAVTVLSGLKVFQGYDDGSFLPQGAITRAEVAAIIYRIVTGDVADTQVGIYADYNKFDDVASTSWYAGYVNFCANAEYIKGYDANTFGPNDPVTGYQALAMILRALGYDKNGEFTGTNWTIQTAAVGEQRGITKNITAGTLNVPATREVVAEILFRAILVNKVNYTPAFGYTEDDTSIGYDTFKLEEIEGVVVANEYADLYSGSPMKAGRTEMIVDGNSYVIDYTSTLEDIGENHAAYITGSTVLTIEKTGNTVFETGAATDIGKDSDFEDVTSLERDEDTTEEFLNFGQDGKWTCEYMLTYGYDNDLDENGNPAPHTERNVKAGREIDIDELRAVFSDNNGYVYLGTKNTDNSEDYSSTMSWNKFRNEYLENDYVENVDETENGEWLKVIDNDGDGVADYVLKTEFAMSVIERIAKDNTYYLADLANDDAVSFDDEVEIDGADIVTEDELAADDVVIYTLIDGKYYMSIAEMVTETVDRKGINSKTETMTCNGTEYVQSHIGYGDGDIYYHDVTEAHTEETYDLYLDHFGYVRLFVESDYNTFMLLTDGWYEDDNRTETFQAYYWDVEAGEETLIDVVDDDDNFISNDQRGDEETWGNLWGADVTYSLNNYIRPNTFASNIAGYSETDDGYDLKSVEDSAERMNYTVQAFEVDGLKDKSLNAYDSGYDIQTTSDTQYYLVIRSADNRTASGWSVDDVITWTGYANAPAEAKLVDGAVGYAVTHASKASSTYTVADVVVFETTAYADRNTYFVYNPNNYLDFINRDRVEFVWGVGYDEEGAISNENQLLVEDDDDVVVNNGLIEFYEIFDNETVNYIGDTTGEYAEYNIYAGWARTSWDVEGRNYVRVSVAGVADDMYVYDDAPVYKVTFDVEDGYNVTELNRDKVDVDDLMILFTDSDKNVEYAINVSASLYEKLVITPVLDLWTAIRDDAFTVDELTFYGAVDADDDHSITLTYAEAAAKPTGLYAGGRDILSITSGGSSVTIPTTPVKSGAVYTVVTEDKTGREEVWTLTVQAARTTTELTSSNANVVINPTIAGTEYGGIDYVGHDKMSIEEFIALLDTKDGAEITSMKFWNDQGEVKDYSQTLSNVTEMEIVVTAEDGVHTQTYVMDAAADQDATDKAVAAAIDKAIEDLETAILNAIKTEATSKGVTLSKTDAEILADDETDTSAFGYGDNYATVADALETWSSELESKKTIAEVTGHLSTLTSTFPTSLANAYVATLKNAADQKAFKDIANEKAAEYAEYIKTQLEANSIQWNGGTVEKRVEDAIKSRASTLKDYNMREFTYEVEAPADFSLEGATGQKSVTVKVTVTNEYATVLSDEQSVDVTVIFTW